MSGFLFNEIIFGPVKSRRLGVSLGINLLPTEYKCCTYNCTYCECGWTEKKNSKKIPLPKRDEIYSDLEKKLIDLTANKITPDNLTFAGNGEPTIHPEFAGIVEDTIALRNQYFPNASTTVLSNASQIYKAEIINALRKVDNSILKLDAGSNDQFQKINLPSAHLSIEKLVQQLCQFNGDLIIQTLFLSGFHNGERIDNTTKEELSLWIEHLKLIKPKLVMIYSLDRETPAKDMVKIPFGKLNEIASSVYQIGIKAEVY
ncbi:MAG: radical SAM protein [Bacteroidetes bacterium]|nr:radical SAM protein [Bacteroidota bacterium]